MLARSFVPCLVVFVSFLFLALLAPPARAQCFPDGLDGGQCCQQPNLVQPQYPPISQGIRYICFDNCQAVVNTSYCVSIGTPAPVLTSGGVVCGVYRIPFDIKLCGTNTLLWTGKLTAHYSRNWQEFPVVGAIPLTVWRFVLNGDLLPTSAVSNNPLFKPACVAQFQRVYFSGYIDYAFDCGTNTWQAAWALDHGCDSIHHQLGTARPGNFHPTRSFTFVGPGAGFVVAPTGAAQSNGTIFQQAVRWNNWANAPAVCMFEEPATGSFQALAPGFCQCPGGAVAQYVVTLVNATGTCGTMVSPSSTGQFLQKKIGRWTNQNVFPGNEALRFDFGYLDYQNACTPPVTNEWFEGVETLRGYLAVDFQGIALGSQFEDLGSSNLSASSQAVLIGAPHLSYYMLNFNMQ